MGSIHAETHINQYNVSMNRIPVILAGSICIFLCSVELAPQDNKDWFLEKINAPRISPGTATEPVIIAIVDDGMRTTHQDIRPLLWNNPNEIPDNGVDDDGNSFVDDFLGWDISDNDPNVDPPSDRLLEFYHGTHLAGILVTTIRKVYQTDPSELIRVLPVKALADRSERPYLYDGYKGIDYAVEAGAQIVLCAWSAGPISAAEERILEKAADRNVLVIGAAGNNPNGQEQYPAAARTVLAVAALDRQDRKWKNSNYGQFIDLSAPGSLISSAGVRSDNSYEEKEGTSQAAAVAAAAAAVLLIENPALSTRELIARLKQSARNIDHLNPRFNSKLGAGILDLTAALREDLLVQDSREKRQLTNPQGYLNLLSTGNESAGWAIQPRSDFSGIRLMPWIREGNPGDSEIRIYRQEGGRQVLLRDLKLEEMSKEIFIPGKSAYVILRADAEVESDSNWLLEYRADPIDYSRLYCRDTVSIYEEGVIEDGSGEENYSYESDCKWLVTAPEGMVVKIRFLEFDTEAKTDLVYFFNGSGTHEDIMAIFSGPDIPPELTTWGNRVLIWFVTDSQNHRKGWKAEIRFQPAEN